MFGGAVSQLPGKPASLAALAYAAVEELRRNGAIHNALFDYLTSTFPNRAQELEPLRAELIRGAVGTPRQALSLRYLEWVSNEYDRVRIFHGPGTKRRLNAVYVPLLSRRLSAEPVDGMPSSSEAIDTELTLEDLLEQRPNGRWTLQGEPGSGKSTELRHLAYVRAQQARARLLDGAELPLGTVPLLVSLPELAEYAPNRSDSLFALIANDVVQTTGYDDIDPEALRAGLARYAKDGRALLLLDGFDEVRPERRELTLSTIGEYEQHLRAPIVVASRRFGYQQPSEDFTEVALLPLDVVRQRELLENWELPTAAVDDILEVLRAYPTLRELASNPFLLTMFAFLARDRDSAPLPRRRAELYQQVVKRYIYGCARPDNKRPHVELSRKSIHDGLRELSLSLLQAHSGPWTTAELEHHLRKTPEFDAYFAKDPQLVAGLAADTGLLEPVGRARARWGFRHRLFLECLAAEALSKRGPDGIRTFAARIGGRRQWWNPWSWALRNQTARWSEVFAILAGLSDERPIEFLAPLREVNEALALRSLANIEEVEIGELIEVFGMRGSLELIRELITRIEERDELTTRLYEMSRKAPDMVTLLYLDAALFAIGADDAADRIKEELLDGLDAPSTSPRWRRLPPGSFWMGSGDAEGDEDERPRSHVVLTKPFEIMTAPVTHALYAVVTGENPAGDRIDPRRPVERVSWSEARDFCVALSWLQRCPVLLPTEAEWEYACRAGSQSRYCFGDALDALDRYAWFSENAGRRTHRVGRKRPNEWGLYDMHGNVWEWCRDDQARYSGATLVDPVGSLESGWRSARGGSAWDEARFVRSAFRVRFPEHRRVGDCGFRCIRRHPKQRRPG